MRKFIILALAGLMLTSSISGISVCYAEDKVAVTLDANEIIFPDAKPFIDTRSRTLVPIRFVSEAMGADVSWNNDTQTVTIVKNKDTIIYQIGDVTALLNGKIMAFDSIGILKDDRTFVPIRFISELLNCKVDWLESTQTVAITSPPPAVSFPEPKITVHFQEGTYDGRLMWITLDNIREFSDCTNYQFKIDFASPSQFNTYDEDEGAIIGWQKYDLNQFNEISFVNPTITSISRKYYTTRENMKTFKPYDGMPLEFTLTVKKNCSGEEREYYYKDTFKYPYPAN